MPQKVILALYDISNGVARNMSKVLFGKQVDAVYHSALIVYGREYYFGGGICIDCPQCTPFGKPIKKIELGQTELPKSLFKEFLDQLDYKFTPEKYHIIDNNCNRFTNEACQFLLGKGIPEGVLYQARMLTSTPIGKLLKPFIVNAQGSMQNPIFTLLG